MKKKIIILSVLLLSTFLIVCICFINREANLINTFEKTISLKKWLMSTFEKLI